MLDWKDLEIPIAHEVIGSDELVDEVTDYSKPIVFNGIKSCEVFRESARAQMLVGGFGASFKKTDAYKSSAWYQKPVGEKQLEDVANLFAGVEPAFKNATPDDLGEVAAVTKTTWFFGQDSKKFWCSSSRAGLAQLKYQAAGSTMVLVFLPHLFPSEAKDVGFDDMVKDIENMCQTRLKKFIDSGSVIFAEHAQYEFLYVPAGCIIAEQACKKQSLVFGLRRPLLVADVGQYKSYKWLIQSYIKSEKALGKMQEALKLMKPEGVNESDDFDTAPAEPAAASGQPAAEDEAVPPQEITAEADNWRSRVVQSTQSSSEGAGAGSVSCRRVSGHG